MNDAPSQDVGQDVFLDFLNRDARQIFKVFEHLSDLKHRELLAEALNFCVFITRDACLMPPGFLVEDRLVRDLLDSMPAYRDERLVRLPIRETLDEFWAKKEREYRNVREAYDGLFDQEARRFVEVNQRLLIDRPFEVGSKLVAKWEEAPDASRYWQDRLSSYPPTVIELFRRVPRQLADDGLAVTWSAIAQRLSDLCERHSGYRRLVQHVYFSIYVEALGLRVVTGLPLIHESFGLASNQPFYDFNAMKSIVYPTRMWGALLGMSAQSMVGLRSPAGYFEFRRLAWRLCERCTTPYALREATALPPDDQRRLRSGTPELGRLESESGLILPSGSELTVDEADALGRRLADFAGVYLERAMEMEQIVRGRQARLTGVRTVIGRSSGKDRKLAGRNIDGGIAVFTALREERDVLIRDWALTQAGGSPPRWSGVLGTGTSVTLYTAERMGRVPAAVATSRFLAEARPQALLIVGIAGGFAESEVAPGDILVASTVADLATRKVTSDEAADGRVRPQPYELDVRLGRYLDSAFNFKRWSHEVSDELDWPSGRHPRMNPGGPGGSLASIDEVVASDERRSALLAAWPKLLGVEMEAGGVLAAVREFAGSSLPVFHLRIVSDMADPAKTDTEWRRLGVRTLANLVNQVSWDEVLAE